jgi:hypothetical protein
MTVEKISMKGTIFSVGSWRIIYVQLKNCFSRKRPQEMALNQGNG